MSIVDLSEEFNYFVSQLCVYLYYPHFQFLFCVQGFGGRASFYLLGYSG